MVKVVRMRVVSSNDHEEVMNQEETVYRVMVPKRI